MCSTAPPRLVPVRRILHPKQQRILSGIHHFFPYEPGRGVTYTLPMTNDRKHVIQAICICLGLLLLSLPIFSQGMAATAPANTVHLAAKFAGSTRTGIISWQNLRGEGDYNRAVVFYMVIHDRGDVIVSLG